MPLPKVDHALVARTHQKRVTLNLIRHAAACPERLKTSINNLEAVDWDLESLDKVDQETIFGLVNDGLADRCRDEFVADLSTIRDLDRDPNPTNPRKLCTLCGHHPIRWEFDLTNVAGGTSTKTGSVCIEEYGLNVDGYGSAEAALKALHSAIRLAKRKAEIEDWQEAHPDHSARMKRIEEAGKWCRLHAKLRPWQLYQLVRPDWESTVDRLGIRALACVRHYRRHGLLSPARTRAIWGGNPIEGQVALFQTELEGARRALVGGEK